MNTKTLTNQADAALRNLTNCRFQGMTGNVLRDGDDLAILTTDQTAAETLLAARKLDRECVHAKVIAIHTDSGVERNLLREACRTGLVFIVDSPETTGQFRRTMKNAFEELIPFPVRSIRLEAGNPESGLAGRYEAGADAIYTQVVNAA